MPKPFLLSILLALAGWQPATAQNQATTQNQATAPSPTAPGSFSSIPSPILEAYIHTGLDSNLALHQRNFDLGRAQLDLKRAQSLFYPQAGFSSQYTLANGGRTQEIPVGDLLNGVYSTLNQLTGSNKFPQVPNQSIPFLPNDFHDTKMEVTLPILNTDMQHNKEVNREMIGARQADRDIYRRDLVRNIRQAYYQYLQAGKALEIYNTALTLVKENRRVSEKFVENHMATREIVMRSQAQVSQVGSSLIEATNNRRNAAAYFNFLLNQPLETPVLTDSTLMAATAPTSSLPSGIPAPGPATTSPATADPAPTPIANREEFNLLSSYRKISESNLKWDRAYLVPRLNAFYDIGFQGFGFHFNSSQFYQLAGLQLTWSLFKGNDNKYKISQARIDMGKISDQYRILTQQLTLENQTTLNNYYSARETLRSLADEVASTRETYRYAEKRFNEGQALQIELIDARTQMTNAEIRYSLARLTLLNRAADLERVTAAYKFPN